jgi:phosphatidylethanolamine-binding protein (PEBP) family uncharacterized protein
LAGAAPPANSGMHRYAFFVFKQKSQGQVNAEECTKYCEVRAKRSARAQRAVCGACGG